MCLFCKISNKDIPAKIVYEDEHVMAFLDISQTTKGHTLVIPKIHTNNFLECPPEYLNHVAIASSMIGNHLMQKLNAKGMNVITNIEKAAGQTIMHYHVHLIPRYDETDGITLNFKENKNIDLDELLLNIKID